MSAHTPGPWTYEADQDDLGGFVIELGDTTEIQRIEQVIEYAEGLFPEDGDQWDTADANARLIAAAPEMYEAAREMVAELDAGELGRVSHAREKLRRAVARARGEVAR